MNSIIFKFPGKSLLNPLILRSVTRGIGSTSILRLKQIDVVQEKETINIKANYVPSEREPQLLEEFKNCQNEGKHFCPECTLGLDLKHTDVLILSQYLRPDGCMLPRRVTGLCKRQQKRISVLVAMAQKAGLMSNLTPSFSKKDPKARYGWKKFNKYFDETTIKY